MLFDIGEPKSKTKREERQAARIQAEEERKAAWARQAEEWKVVSDEVSRTLLAEHELLMRYGTAMLRLFAAMEGEPSQHERRPNISLRLIAEGDPPAKLITLPGWDRINKTIDRDWLSCELLTETTVETKKGPAKQWMKVLAFGFGLGHPARVATLRKSALEDLERVLGTIRSFTLDHRSVLARARDNCAICGRVLTDELSRSRGIGPECIQKAPWLVTYGNHSILEAEAIR